MEPHTLTEDSPQSRSIIEGQVRELYGRTVYSHKTHEKCSDIISGYHYWLRIVQIFLSALTTAGFVATIFGGGALEKIAGLLISIILLCINSYTKDYNLGEHAQKHRSTATSLWLVREKLQYLLVDIAMKEKPLTDLQTKRDDLIKDLHEIYKNSPGTTTKAYVKAQKALKINEELTFSDQEIDMLLPKELRRT